MSTLNDNGHWSDWLPAPPAAAEPDGDDDSRGVEFGSAGTELASLTRRGRSAVTLSAALRRHRVVISASLAVAVIAGGAAWLWPHPSPATEPVAQHAATTTTVAPVARPDTTLGGGPGCDPIRTPNLVRGNGTGSLSNGPDAILAFEHAYYTLRSGTAARAVTTPDAAVPSAADIDAGIGTLAPETSACVVIVPMNPGRYHVSITETAPEAAPRTFTQLITTTGSGGDTRVIAITGADS
ncbi:hypothetical protein HLB23_28045 [Nocardia uniformis]|uniref:DUF8176 domain-containing protein n=1 Tax=Nocardia uniformis TaxID=53432 RepID=A0A849C7D3_9NOCA|nr:hypothetical protein [Nocardia uniformis]NNH73658.1 hypothetical protein [Nocardia uniformis]